MNIDLGANVNECMWHIWEDVSFLVFIWQLSPQIENAKFKTSLAKKCYKWVFQYL